MRSLLNILWTAIIVGLTTASARAAHTQVELLLPAETAKPGSTIITGVRLKMDTGWHTYWKNSGASGIPTTIKWELPAGLAAGEIQWPVPEKMPPDDLTTYVYENEVVLLVPLTLAADLKPGPLVLRASVGWLECQVKCVPGSANISATLNIGAESKPSPDATAIQAWQKKLPGSAVDLSPRAEWEPGVTNDSRALILEWKSTGSVGAVDFFPAASEDFEVQAEVRRLPAEPGKVRLRKLVKKFQGDWPKQISGVLIDKSGAETSAYDVTLPIAESSSAPSPARTALDQPLWKMLLYAFIGGLILNIMPCVLPVIALKILGFVQQSKEEPRQVFRLGLIYGFGVLVSFIVMAGLVIVIQHTGGSASWGMQFKSPQFSVGLIVLVTLIALNLFGVFEINLGGRTLNAAGQLASRHGASGAFFNGVLATVLATPCTAPVLATALGFAFTQTSPVILLFFITIGAGLAAPYVVLSWRPGWLKFLPKPGAWMEQFKVAMGFPMLATAVWIFWFTAPRFGDAGILWIGWFLIAVALAAWVWGQFVQRGQRRLLAMAICCALVLAGYGFTLEKKLHWRSPAPTSAGELQNNPDGVAWQKWSMEAIEKARAEGRVVLVDFTAKWCTTCNAFVKPAVDNDVVRRKLEAVNGLAFLADYTDYSPALTAELKKYHSDASVPLVLVYPRASGQPPTILPTVPTRQDVLAALDQAAR